jgi:hypothetical protein
MARKEESQVEFRFHSEIIIHGHLWKIKIVPDDILNAAFNKDLQEPVKIVSGYCDYEEYEICIATSKLGKLSFTDVLFHEISHAVLADLTQMDMYNEELVVETMGRELPNLIVQVARLPQEWFKGSLLDKKV